MSDRLTNHPVIVLFDTARLLDDLAQVHATPAYVRSYAKDVRKVARYFRKHFDFALDRAVQVREADS
jgi:hypothetical protein